MDIFKDKTLLITGGTGSFGKAVLKRLRDSKLKKIIIFSRDEKKQDDLRKQLSDPKVQFIIGDVRDHESVKSAMNGVDYIFHAAALKQVPSCEFFPIQAVKTNVLGTNNVLNAALSHGVKKVVVLSTDKAVYPINAMGISKAMMEKVVVAKSKEAAEDGNTTICCTRYGNVMASRGSVIPLFKNQILEGNPITVTDPEMTRFMMTLEQAVELVLFAFNKCENGDIFVQKSPAATITTLVDSIKTLMNKPDHEVKVIGTRHGEKLYETLLTREEKVRSVDLGNYYRIPSDNRDLNYTKFYESGETVVTQAEEYHSHNTHRLDKNEMMGLLKEINEFQ